MPAAFEPAAEPELVLYDLASVHGVCFSPVVWKIRLMLNYKRIPYRTEFLDIGPLPDGEKYTVPTIQHLASGTWLMDSRAIARWLEDTYPARPITLTSPLSDAVVGLARAAGMAAQYSLAPREPAVLSPRSRAYFVSMVEGLLGHPLGDLLQKEEAAWAAADEGMKEASELMMRNCQAGPYTEGERPCAADFFVAGAMASARAIHEGTWEREYAYEGFARVYDGLRPLMERGSW
ncbi:hypothetical protein Q8F55_004060 [Vanrija albida]|uniref:GST N-terminal domain-containing protein n=1 Tax=Vanrija albida TaxID=181172 RepID=A0ABR3Q6T9_9TREE